MKSTVSVSVRDGRMESGRLPGRRRSGDPGRKEERIPPMKNSGTQTWRPKWPLEDIESKSFYLQMHNKKPRLKEIKCFAQDDTAMERAGLEPG